MVDFTFTEEQDMFRESAREFCEKNIKPKIEEMLRNKEIPADVIKAMAEFEILGASVSEEYGGAGLDAVTAGIVAEELGRTDYSCSIPVLYLVECAWSHVFNKYGTEEAKREILPKVVRGELMLGIATTEADAGSDLGGTRTRIEKTSDGYVVNGEKSYISLVREAVKYGGGHVTIAKLTPELGVRGMALFYLPLTAEGITPTYYEEVGREGVSFGGFNIDNVKIPAHYLIGEENRGFYIVHEGYEYARGLIALVCVGAGQKALENGINYIKERKAFGRALAKYEGIQFSLAEHYTKLEAAKLLAYKALWQFDREKEGKCGRFEVSKAIAMAKLVAPLWAFDAINDVMQWQGAFGYTKECVDESALRGVRSFTLAEGSTEVMKLIIARELLGRDFIAYK